MATFYKYRIYCDTDSKWEYIWDTVEPTVCPTNAGHTVNSNSVSDEDKVKSKTIDDTDSPYKIKKKALLCDTTSGNIDVYLRKASKNTNRYSIIKKINANNTLTIHSYDDVELIDASTTKAITVLNEICILKSDGTKWITQSIDDSTVIEDEVQNVVITEAKGDMVIDNGDEQEILSIGTDGQVLCSDSTQTSGMKWSSFSNSIIIPIFKHNTHEKTTTSSSWEIQACFIFNGTSAVGTPTSAKASTYVSEGSSGGIRIYDVTNSQVICSVTNLSNTSLQINDLGTISNLPTGEAVFEVQVKNNGTSSTSINSIILNF